MGHGFWAYVEWTLVGKELLAGLERLFHGEVVLMTSPCDTEGSVSGKVEWIRRELPAYSRRFFVGPCKHAAAGPGKVLIDDHDANVDMFKSHGGRAVLVPRPWNQDKWKTKAGLFDPEWVLNDAERIVGEINRGA